MSTRREPQTSSTPVRLSSHLLRELAIEDEASFRHVGLYADLKQVLVRSEYRFLVLPPAMAERWDRALLLNLTFWGPGTSSEPRQAGGDILTSQELAADVVTHAAWHHLAGIAFHREGQAPSTDALFLGEAIASAFDIYLVGRLLGHVPDSTFLETQVPAMLETAEAAGMSQERFDAMLDYAVEHPEAAFEELRQLLFDATRALFACQSPEQGLIALSRFDDHRFAPLLHRYELSNWVLYARAYAPRDVDPDAAVLALDAELRAANDSLAVLERDWVSPHRHGTTR